MTTLIYWGPIQENDYFHGTRYRREGKAVFFDNPFMPATLVIHRWSSLRPYQATRRPVDLPLLKKGHRYCLRKHMEVFEGNSLYLKVLFYDRYDELVSQVFIKEEAGEFSYPKEAYRYEIELVNTACQCFRFDYLSLTEQDIAVADTYYPKLSAPLTVLFQEAFEDSLPETLLASFGNVLLISPEEVTGDFVSEQRLPGLEQLISEKLTQYQEARLVAYGPYGGLAVTYLSFFLPNTKGYHQGIDREALAEPPFSFGFYLDDVLPRQYFGQNLVTYTKADRVPIALFPKGNDLAIRQLFHLTDFLAETERHDIP